MEIRDNPTWKNKYFYLFCLFHFISWTFVMVVCNANPTNDSLEGIAWGRLWQWGYPEHPFLAPWLTAFVTDLFGVVGLPIYCLASFCVVVCFWSMWRLAKKILSPWQAFIAIILLEGIYYYNVEPVNFNPNILMLPLWALLCLSFYNALKIKGGCYWVAVGFCAGLAFVTKYESLILFFLLFIILIVTSEGRLQLRKPDIYYAIIIFFIIISPHLFYLYENDFNAVWSVIEKVKPKSNHFIFNEWLYHPFKYLVVQILAIAPLILLSVPFVKNRQINNISRKNMYFKNTFDQLFFLILAFGPLSFSIFYSFIMNTELAPRWAIPFFSFMGIVWIAYLNPRIDSRVIKQFFVATFFWIVLVSGLMIKASVVDAYYKVHDFGANHFPGVALTQSVYKRWVDLYHTDPMYVVGDYRYVSNVAAHSKYTMLPFFEGNIAKSPWINLNDMHKKGAIFICRFTSKGINPECQKIANQYHITHETVISLHPITSAKVRAIQFWVGFLAPA